MPEPQTTYYGVMRVFMKGINVADKCSLYIHV